MSKKKTLTGLVREMKLNESIELPFSKVDTLRTIKYRVQKETNNKKYSIHRVGEFKVALKRIL
jgi:hypothetical protein